MLSNCMVTNNTSGTNGGGVLNFGGTTTLTGCTISGNSASGGGGLWSNGSSTLVITLTVTNCTVSGNTAVNVGGGVDILSNGTATLTNCTIQNNTITASGGGGGGLYDSGTATLTNCTISGNTVPGSNGSGGGLQASSGSTTMLTGCTVSGNSVGFNGGALANYGASITLTNCTLSGNTSGSTGGGVGASNLGGTTTLTDCTVSGNSAVKGGGLADQGDTGTVALGNTIVAGNTATTSGPDAYGSFGSSGHNLVGKTDGSSGWVGSDLTGTIAAPLKALLASLGNYGGPTQTMALQPGSPALGKGTGASGITTDQRGAPRATSGPVDIGAFQDEGYTVAVASGSGQSATPGSAFPNPLVALLTENFASAPIPGVALSFTAPTTGASATLSAASATTNASGQASVTATANATAGNYTVTASATGVAATAAFSLTNAILTQPVIQLSDGGVYSGSAFAAAATITPNDGSPTNTLLGIGLSLTYYVGAGTGGTNMGSTAPTNAGTFTVVAAYPGAGQYFPASGQTTFMITPATLTASIIGAPTRSYDTTAAAALTAANFSLSGLISGQSFTVTQTSGSYNSANVTSATTVTASLSAGNFTAGPGTLAGKYTLPTSASGAGAISPGTFSAAIIGTPTRPYDGTATATLTAANFSLSGLVSGQSFTVTQTAGTYNSANVTSASTVTASLSAPNFTAGTGTLASNYTLPTIASGPGAINPASVTATINGTPTRSYDGTTNATLTPASFSLTGVASGQSFTVTQTAGTYNSRERYVGNHCDRQPLGRQLHGGRRDPGQQLHAADDGQRRAPSVQQP